MNTEKGSSKHTANNMIEKYGFSLSYRQKKKNIFLVFITGFMDYQD